MCQTAFVLPPTLVYPLQGISVDLKTSTDIAFYCKPFELKLYLINNKFLFGKLLNVNMFGEILICNNDGVIEKFNQDEIKLIY